MGADPARSVVDPELRCHQHKNLFIAGSAVFPTGGTANPTLTIAALSLRLADTIAVQLKR
jgi:choline dehydrogenase-like flavoprotein